MSVQNPKRLVDTGVEGVEGTGDTLFQGGTSLNRNLNSLYNVMGDYRIFKTDSAQGDQIQTLHATGFYQKHSRAYYSGAENPSGNPVEFGSLHDVSVTRDGSGDLTVTLPAGLNKQGECIEIINTDGSIGYGAGKELIIRTSGAGDSIINFGSSMKLQKPHFKITLWVQSSAPTGATWNYKIEALYGDQAMPYSVSMSTIAPNNSRTVNLFQKSGYHSVKHLIFATERGTNVSQEMAEVLLMVNNTNQLDYNVYHTEYARVRSKDPSTLSNDLLYTAEYSITAGGVVRMTVTNISNVAIDVFVKAIDAIGREM